MQVLITGGCGFIGKNLIRSLLEKQADIAIRVVDNLSTGSRADLEYATTLIREVPADRSWAPGVVQLAEFDILDAEKALEYSPNADIIVHLAANTGVGPSV